MTAPVPPHAPVHSGMLSTTKRVDIGAAIFNMETWVDSECLYAGQVVTLRVGTARLDDGTEALREVVEHPGGVGIAAVHEGRVILIRQYRIAVGQDVLEIPAGKLEGGEDPAHRARRELAEETGYTPGRLVPAGTIYASVGYTSEKIHLFLAFDLEHVGQDLEHDEAIDVEEIPLARAQKLLTSNAFEDAKTAIAVQRLLTHLGR